MAATRQVPALFDLPADAGDEAVLEEVRKLGRIQGMAALQALSLERIAGALERIADVAEAREQREAGQ